MCLCVWTYLLILNSVLKRGKQRREGGRDVPQILNHDIAARVAMVGVLVRIGHAVPAVVGAERAAVVGEVDAVVRGAVVDLRGEEGEGGREGRV